MRLVGGLHAKKKSDCLCFSRQQRNTAGESPAGIFIIAGGIAEISGFHAQRIAISAVFAKEAGFVAAVGACLGTGEADVRLHFSCPLAGRREARPGCHGFPA